MPLADLTQEDFSAGVFRSVDRRLIPDNGAWDIVNGLLNDDGSIYRRGGVTHQATAFASGTGMRWAWDAVFTAGRRTLFATDADFGVLAADDVTPVNLGGAGLAAPVRAAQVGDLLFIDGGTVYAGSRRTAGYNAGTVSVTNGSAAVTGAGTSWLANADAGMLLSVAGGRYYVVQQVNSDTSITLTEPYVGSTAAGSAYTLSVLGTADDATGRARDAQHYAAIASRLITLEGRQVWVSDSIDPTTGRLQSQVFQANSYHELPGGAEGLGVAAVGTKALVFTTRGLFAITNLAFDIVDRLGNQQHAVQHLSEDLILWGKAGLGWWQQSVIAPCTDGIYLLDGTSSPTLLSRSITPLLSDYQRQGLQPGGAAVFRNHYFLPVLDTAGTVQDMLVCRLDRAAQTRIGMVWPWTRVEGYGGNMAALTVRVGVSGSARQPVMFGAPNNASARLANMSAMFTPDVPYAKDADGSTHEMSVVTRDYSFGHQPDFVRRVRVNYVLTGLEIDAPRLQMQVATGPEAVQGDVPLWDVAQWDVDFWTGETGGEYGALDGTAPPDDGRQPWAWQVGSHTRSIRYRVVSAGAPGTMVVRGVTTVHRQNRSAI
jgi:hypothetical protein